MNTRGFLATVFLAAIAANSTVANTVYPDLIGQDEPTTDYRSLPDVGFPVGNQIAVNPQAPEIAEWTRKNGPGETLALTGERFSMKSGDQEGRDTQFLISGENGIIQDTFIQRLDGKQCALTLPDTLNPNELYLLWPRNEQGLGRPVAINQTELWWANDSIPAGESFRVFGQNLTAGTKVSHLFVVELNEWLTCTNANPYMAEYTFPEGTGPGTYTVYAHNGRGRKFGWSRPLEINVWSGYGYSDNSASWYDVTEHGLVGDGVTDNRDAIEALWNTVANDPWPTIYFPEGDYVIGGTQTFVISGGSSQGVRILGQGPDRSVIMCKTVGAHTESIRLQKNKCVVKDITFETHETGINDFSWGMWLWHTADSLFENVRWSGLPMRTRLDRMPLTGGDNKHLVFRDCEFFLNKPLSFDNGYGFTFENCNFRNLLDCGSIGIGAIENMALVDSEAGHYDDSDENDGHGWGKGRWFVSGLWRASTHWYIGGNTSSNMQPRVPSVEYTGTVLEVENNFGSRTLPSGHTWNSSRIRVPVQGLEDVEFGWWPDAAKVVYENHSYECYQGDPNTGWIEILHEHGGAFQTGVDVGIKESVNFNAGEQFMKEGGLSIYRGNASSATADTVSFSDLSSYLSSGGGGVSAVIVSGKGLGQSRLIKSVSGNTATLYEPWQVIPDSSSAITIGQYATRWALYDNYLHANLEKYVNGLDSASAAVQFSAGGGGHSVIIENNTFHGVDRGIALDISSSDVFSKSVNTVSPWYFGRIEANTFRGVMDDFLDMSHAHPDTGNHFPQDAIMVGSVYRGNQSYDAVHSVFYTGTSIDAGHLMVWEKNYAEGFANLHISNYMRDNDVWIGNTFVGDGNDVGPRLYSSHTPAMIDNVYQGFSDPYPESAHEVVLELPLRRIVMDAPVEQVIVRQAGSGSMNWSASADVPWLNFTPTSGTVENERETGTIDVSLNSTPADGSTAILTISAGGQSKQVSVVYDAASIKELDFLSIQGGDTLQERSSAQAYQCVAHFTDGTTGTVSAVWSTDSTDFATISFDGLLTPNSLSENQSVIIQAAYGGETASKTVQLINLPPQAFNVSYVAGENGFLTGSVQQEVLEGGDATSVEAHANEGFYFVRWIGSVISADNPLLLTDINSDVSVEAQFAKEGGSGITREVWFDVPGAAVQDLTGSSDYQANPERKEILGGFETSPNSDDHYGQRIHGFLIPPVSGEYTFWIAGDDNCELWLSSDALPENKIRIAHVPDWAEPYEWDKFPSQQSAAITLEAGRRYYIQALHKESAGGDHMGVAWSGPGIAQSIIPGEHLEPHPTVLDQDVKTFPLSGFEGKTVRVEIWDSEKTTMLSEQDLVSPTEVQVGELSDGWYTLTILEWDSGSSSWNIVFENPFCIQ